MLVLTSPCFAERRALLVDSMSGQDHSLPDNLRFLDSLRSLGSGTRARADGVDTSLSEMQSHLLGVYRFLSVLDICPSAGADRALSRGVMLRASAGIRVFQKVQEVVLSSHSVCCWWWFVFVCFPQSGLSSALGLLEGVVRLLRERGRALEGSFRVFGWLTKDMLHLSVIVCHNRQQHSGSQ